jgi:hypothetical protein
MLQQREFTSAKPLLSFDDLRISQRHQPLVQFNPQAKRHYYKFISG